jgi:outer membrane protein assembly factor BamD
MTPEERLKVAKKLLEKGDYYDAKTQFTILALNYPGTPIADEAQYYLAESHFGLKEYILAAAEYEKLVRNYPQSEFVDDAEYKVALCYYKLSPHYALDQKYTRMAIEKFQQFLEDFPNSPLKSEAEKRLRELRNKLAKKEFKNAELYRKLQFYQSAIIYYDEVLNNYYDSPYAEEALFRKGESLLKLKKFSEAEKVFEIFLQKYPKSSFLPAVRKYLKQARENLKQMTG